MISHRFPGQAEQKGGQSESGHLPTQGSAIPPGAAPGWGEEIRSESTPGELGRLPCWPGAGTHTVCWRQWQVGAGWRDDAGNPSPCPALLPVPGSHISQDPYL